MRSFKYLILSSLCISFGVAGCQSLLPIENASLSQVQNIHLALPEEKLNQIDFRKLKFKHQRPIVALVLGSGGARGYAHIGVIDVLEKNGIKPDFIVGTSAGSIVGSIYASGKSAEELKDIALNLQPNDVRDLTIRLKGFFVGEKVESYINKQVEYKQLQELKIPMYVVATELKEGRKAIFNYGNTGQAVRASISIPSMFIPAKIGEEEFVDGGLVSPVPVEIARDLGADIVIAVDILAQPVYTETSNVWGLFNQNINIMQQNIALSELKDADIIIRPDLREKNHIFDVKGREKTIQEGVDAATKQLSSIFEVFEVKKQHFKKTLDENHYAYY
ncbi:patatin-like phospholipase family protein [Acinetobacter equi]|uniref:Alpha/beta hydrolase n=1 Tax=Acinetobacter equi TaxID=1324350 RepID=A0A0N9WDU2_9GAMM|nr:patatin-like phospholipase family protein [Acinetobacter equi]ALH95453.1 alpha/beta hydrolase [Acinetobacter equi]